MYGFSKGMLLWVYPYPMMQSSNNHRLCYPFHVPLALWGLGLTQIRELFGYVSLLSLYMHIHNARLSTFGISPKCRCRFTKPTAIFVGKKPLQSGETQVEIFEVQLQDLFFVAYSTNSELPWLRANCQCCHWQLLVRHPAMHCNHWNPLFWHQRRVIQVGDSGHPIPGPGCSRWQKRLFGKNPPPKSFKMLFF